MAYSEEFKDRVVSRILSKELSLAAAVRQYKVSENTLRAWKAKALNDTISPSKSEKSNSPMPTLHLPAGVSYLQAYKAVVLMETLSETEFGAYCRKHGLTAESVKGWSAWFAAHPDMVCSDEHRETKKRLQAAQGEIQALGKKVRKQEKALAEYGIMMALAKKAQAIYGREDS